MTTTIRGTDNTAASPALTGTDTTTGIFFPSTGAMAFSTAGTEDMRIDSAGNVGIGTSSPTVKLDVQTSADASINVQSTGTIQSAFVRIVGRQSSVNEEWNIVSTGAGLGSPALRFVRGTWTNTPSASIDSSGIFSCNLTQSAAASGYVKLPSGIIIQWGTANASTGGTTSNFPIAFPNSAWSMVAVNNNQTNPPAPSTLILSLSQFRLTVLAGGPNCYFIAIGN